MFIVLRAIYVPDWSMIAAIMVSVDIQMRA